MANAFDPIIANEKREEIEGDIIKSDESMGEIAHDKSDLQSASDSLKDFIQTYITFNKGGSWHLLKSPERDSAGKKYECGDKCYLNLHATSKKTAGYYSVPSAVGLILGNGNVGQYLTSNSEEISTFLSRDGGFTWIEVVFIIKID